jgi:hypothetical protein
MWRFIHAHSFLFTMISPAPAWFLCFLSLFLSATSAISLTQSIGLFPLCFPLFLATYSTHMVGRLFVSSLLSHLFVASFCLDTHRMKLHNTRWFHGGTGDSKMRHNFWGFRLCAYTWCGLCLLADQLEPQGHIKETFTKWHTIMYR